MDQGTVMSPFISSTNSSHSKPNILPTQFYATITDFVLESSQVLPTVTVAFSINGRLNKSKNNVVLVCHALSGSSDVLEWWSSIFEQTKPSIDLDAFCVVCCNCLGSPYGSTSPLSCRPGTTNAYNETFPSTTIRDDVRLHKRVLDMIGVRSIYCVVGASMGGMHAVEWPLMFGHQYVMTVILIATTARQSPWAIAWAENQRSTIKSDSKYRDGRYGDDPPTSGLAAARMAAMLSYRTHSSFSKRFGRRRWSSSLHLPDTSPRTESKHSVLRKDVEIRHDPEYQRDGSNRFLAQTYLQYQGAKFNSRFDANCYMHILDKIDTHDISRGRHSHLADDAALKETLAEIRQPALIIGVHTDGLYPLEEQITMAKHMPKATLAVVESDDGHDGFLLEGRQINDLLYSFFRRNPLNPEGDRDLDCWNPRLSNLANNDQVEIKTGSAGYLSKPVDATQMVRILCTD